MAVVALLSACSKSNEEPTTAVANPEDNSIRLNAGVWRIKEGRRASTIDNNTALQGQDLKISAYFNGTNTAYLADAKLHYDTDAWVFWNGSSQLHYYWPIEGSVYTAVPLTVSSLDFVGYCPYTTPGYISELAYAYGTGFSFDCDLTSYFTGATQASMPEFLYAYSDDQTYSDQVSAGGVPLNFQHPFAKIILKISADQPKEVTITSITLKDIYKTGSYTSSGLTNWNSLGDEDDFVITFSPAQTFSDHSEQIIDVPYIMIPQNWGGEIEVAASWKNWGETVSGTYSATVATNWEAGHSYTYSFKFSDYDLIVDIANFTEQW